MLDKNPGLGEISEELRKPGRGKTVRRDDRAAPLKAGRLLNTGRGGAGGEGGLLKPLPRFCRFFPSAKYL